MQIFVAENLKRLRKARGNTQEDLARHIGITVQSVSKWERGEGYPDIELLPVIAEFYSVSTDDLLGVGKAVKDKAIKEFVKKCDKAGEERNFAEELRLCREIYLDYPNDETVMRHYMNALRRNGYFDESIEMTRRVLDETEDYQARYEALRNGIFCIGVSYDGDLEESKSFAKDLPDYFTTKNQQYINLLSGDELVPVAKSNIEDLMLCLCANIRARQCDMHTDEKIQLWKKAAAVIDAVCEDGDYGNLTEQFLRFGLFTAHDYGLLGKKEEAIAELEKCAEIATKYDLSDGGEYTSILMRGKKYRKGTGARAALFRQMNTWGGFDNLREDERFRRILESVRCEDGKELLVAGDASLYDIVGTIELECKAVNENIDTSGIAEYNGGDIKCRFMTRVPNSHWTDVVKPDSEKKTFADFQDGKIVGVGIVDEENAEITFIAAEPENETKCVTRMIAYCAKYINSQGRAAVIKVSPVSYRVIIPANEAGFIRK